MNLHNIYVANTRGELQRRIDRLIYDLDHCDDANEARDLAEAINHLTWCVDQHGR